MSDVTIGRSQVGPGHPCFVIAEIGINHNGDIKIAKDLIDAAAKAGCDAVKFQKRTVELVYTPEELARPRESHFGVTNGALKHGLEFGIDEYREIDHHCAVRGIEWFASCWDEPSVDFISQFFPPCYKVSSASLTDSRLLRKNRATGKPVILSTGMSNLDQVRRAVGVLGLKDLIVMHCVATYPTIDKELNLRVINALQSEFPDTPIGYSGHGYGTTPAVCAVAMGACVVERHFTLDRAMWGSDQSASLEPAGMAAMIKNIRRLEDAFGTGEKRILESEVPILEKLRRVRDF